MKKIFILLALITLWGCQSKDENPSPIAKLATTINEPVKKQKINNPKNIILMIGDGMGITHITAGMIRHNDKLNIERCQYVGLHKCHAKNNLITDSAAGATAFACGVKTYNGAIGVNAAKKSVATILEDCEKREMATGLITTSTIVHATPASFIAHVDSRRKFEAIAAQFLKTEIDFFVGGGKKYFDRRETDSRNLYAELEKKGYLVSDYFKEDLNEVNYDRKRNFAYFTADDDPLPVASGRNYLSEACRVAPRFLKARSRDKGFFLMIEGAQIDWGGHANDADYIISEMLDFDRSIGTVLDWAEKNGETLVIITADHETGGFAVNIGSTQDSLVTKFTTDYHAAELIPVFAFGPGAEDFTGIYDNTDIHYKMKKALGLIEDE
ncbi:MAG: alkaline phosphatase [Bacteroidota bacterium]